MMKNIIAENKKYVRSVIYRLLGKTDEDLEQEVFLKIWQKLPSYHEEGKLKQWICTLTANLCRDSFRTKEHKLSALETQSDDVLENIPDTSRPDDVLDVKTRQKLILRAVDDLPKHYRDVIVLFEFEDYPIEKIASRLKVPTGTIKSRLHNARQILKEKLSYLQGDIQ